MITFSSLSTVDLYSLDSLIRTVTLKVSPKVGNNESTTGPLPPLRPASASMAVILSEGDGGLKVTTGGGELASTVEEIVGGWE